MDALIDFLLKHLVALFYVVSGVSLVLYSFFAGGMTFEGDVAVRPQERKRYRPTAAMRKYVVIMGKCPLLYGLYLLLFR